MILVSRYEINIDFTQKFCTITERLWGPPSLLYPPLGMRGSFPVGKGAVAWSWPLTSI